MAASFVQATIIKHNNTLFLGDDLVVYGYVQLIPTPGSGGRVDGDYWAQPIVGEGVVDGINFIPYGPNTPTQPTPQSFRVFRLITSKAYGKADYWYILGTQQDYVNASQDAECCDATPRVMPDDVPALAPEQLMCLYNNAIDQDYFAVFAVPSNFFGGRLHAYGWYNGVKLAGLSAAGYATPALLNSAMQSAWGATVGGTFVLSADLKTITVTQTAGNGTNTIAVNIFAAVVSS